MFRNVKIEMEIQLLAHKLELLVDYRDNLAQTYKSTVAEKEAAEASLKSIQEELVSYHSAL